MGKKFEDCWFQVYGFLHMKNLIERTIVQSMDHAYFSFWSNFSCLTKLPKSLIPLLNVHFKIANAE